MSAGKFALSNGPYGPNILDVRLGMSLDSAERIIKQANAIEWVLKSKSANAHGLLANQTLFMSKDKIEQIALILTPVGSSNIVIGVTRNVRLPDNTTDDQVEGMLKEKYGTSMSRLRSNDWIWGDASCKIQYQVIPDWDLVDGKVIGWNSPSMIVRDRYIGFRIPELEGVLSDWSRISNCGSVIEAQKTGPFLRLSLADKRLYGGSSTPRLIQAGRSQISSSKGNAVGRESLAVQAVGYLSSHRSAAVTQRNFYRI